MTFTFIGCGAPQKDYDTLQSQLSASQAELASALKERDTTKTQLSSAQNDYNATKSKLDVALNDIKILQDTLTSQSANLSKTQVLLSAVETQLNTTLDTNVNNYYNFIFKSIHYQWQLSIPLRTYMNSKGKIRQTDPSTSGTMVNDTDADAVINVLVKNIEDAAQDYDLKRSDVINLIAKFIQSLPGTNQDVTTSFDGYPRFPLETIFEEGGDSQDTSIMAAILLSRLDYDVVLFFNEAQKHMAAGVAIPGTGGYGWEYQAKKYYYLETTGEGWLLGDCPINYRDAKPVIVPIGR
jgi:hypothetical protein